MLHYTYIGLSCMQCRFSLRSAYFIVNSEIYTCVIEMDLIVEFLSQQWLRVSAKSILLCVRCLSCHDISALKRTKTSNKTSTLTPVPPLRLIYRSLFVIHPRHLFCTTAVMFIRELNLSINVFTQLSLNSCLFCRRVEALKLK
jgi:hypothetical protein